MHPGKREIIKSKILNFLANPVFLTIIIGTCIVFLLPDMFHKYQADLIKREKVQANRNTYYDDLNNDGQTDKIVVISPWDGKTGILISSKGRVLEQFNFDGEFVVTRHVFWADIDNDGSDEIFIFTRYKGNILLHCFKPFSKKILFINRIISKYHIINNGSDFGIQSCGWYDTDGDGWKEFYFSIVSGFSAFPRKMFALNIAKDSLYASPDGCINITYPFATDLDNDGVLEFSGSTQAVGNCDSSALFSDYYSWLCVFTEKMKYRFKPLKIGYYPSILDVITIKREKQNLLIALNLYSGNRNLPCSIGIYDAKGRRVRRKLFDYSEEWTGASLMRNSNNNQKTFYVIKRNGKIEEWDANLNIIATKQISPLAQTKFFNIDVNEKSGNILAALLGDGDQLLVVQKDFKYSLVLDIPGNSYTTYISAVGHGQRGTTFIVAGDAYNYFFDYFQNPYYYFRFLIYLMIFAGIFGMIYLLQKTQHYRVEQKSKAEKKIAELQIKSIKNQLDPHFTFNILNSIGSLFQKQDKQRADYIFGKYSKLLRETILNSDKIKISLQEELDYVQNYLELEKFRLSGAFEFKINAEASPQKKLKIPKMLIHTFVENAIKHGLRHLEKDGKLIINVQWEGNFCLITIDDNGVGREKAKTLSKFSTGKGLKVLDQILDLYQNLEDTKITYSINDKYNLSKKPMGTEIKITIPIKRDVSHESD